MSSSRDRQRTVARLAREMAAKADQKAQQRRRKTIITGSTIGGVVVIVLVIVLIASLSGGGKSNASVAASAAPVSCTWNAANPKPSASASGSATPSTAASSTASAAPSASPSAAPSFNPHLKDVGTPPTTGLKNTGTQTMTISTNLGPVTVAIDDSKTPCAAASFTYLASKKFFDNTSCFQMHNSGYFVIECGDPTGTGQGGPSYTYAPENVPTDNRPTYQQGMVAVGTPPSSSSNGSQFFIVYKDTQDDPSGDAANPTSVLPGQFTVLGTVSSGMDIVQKVAAGGLVPSKSDANTGKPKTALNINTLTVSATAA